MNFFTLNGDCCTEYEFENLSSFNSDTVLQNNCFGFPDESKSLSSFSYDAILQNNFSGFPDESKSLFSHDDYNDTQIYSQNNSLKNSSKLLEYDFTSYLKSTIQNNVTNSSKWNSLFQVISQKSNIGFLCNNPECFNEIKILRFGSKGRKKAYCSKQCFTRRSNCTRKKNCCTNFSKTLLSDRKEFVKFINEGASMFNTDLFYYFFLFREEIKKMQKYLNEKHRPLKEERLSKGKKN
jgi:hypothetical protein